MSSASARPGVSATLRAVADGLTASRLVVALVLVTGTLEPGVAVWVVAWSWLSDTVDGPLARATGRAGRLGSYDHVVDAMVGVAMIWHLGAVGLLPPLASRLVAIALLAGWAATHEMAVQMLLQALANAGFIWWAATSGATTAWVLPGLALALLAIEWRRVTADLVPAFLAGWRHLATGAGREPDRSD